MNSNFEKARQQLFEFKGNRYIHGLHCFDRLGELASVYGKKAAVVMDGVDQPWGKVLLENTQKALAQEKVSLAGEVIHGAKPNAPRGDVTRIAGELKSRRPDVVVTVGGGSTLDAAKAAIAYSALGEKEADIESFFGMGKVTELVKTKNGKLLPMVAVQAASSSAAHLTKYSNITSMETLQKKLIVDDAIVPPHALYDYTTSVSMSSGFTADGALDGVAHALEVYFGAQGEGIKKAEPVAALAIELVVQHIKEACKNPGDLVCREALGLGTDLGGYAIMIGGTNGAHLTSFSLVDILSHGRACALMNPYYTVFFAPAIQPQLRVVGAIYKKAGYTSASIDQLTGRDLGLAVAEAMIRLSQEIGFPTRLSEVKGFTRDHITRALAAAKNPQLEMKLKNMPVPLSAATIDEYMGPILEAATTGDFALIKNING